MPTTLNIFLCKVNLLLLRLAGLVLPNAKKVSRVGGVRLRLRLPRQHELPVYQKYFPFYDTTITRLAFAISAKYPGSKAIDVGANIGDTLALIKAGAPLAVLCIEGAPQFFSLLEENAKLFKGVVLSRVFLSDKLCTFGKPPRVHL